MPGHFSSRFILDVHATTAQKEAAHTIGNVLSMHQNDVYW